MRRNSSLISQGRFSFLSVRNVFALIYSVVRYNVSFQLSIDPAWKKLWTCNCFFFSFLFFYLYLFSFFLFLSNIAMKREWIIPKCLSQIQAFLFPQRNDFRGYSSKSLKIFVLRVLVQTPAVWRRTC